MPRVSNIFLSLLQQKTRRQKYGKKLKNQDCKERFRDKTKTLEKVGYLDGYIYREREREREARQVTNPFTNRIG